MGQLSQEIETHEKDMEIYNLSMDGIENAMNELFVDMVRNQGRKLGKNHCPACKRLLKNNRCHDPECCRYSP